MKLLLHPNVIFKDSVMCLFAALWSHIYVKETKYLNDKEKKSLYFKEEKLTRISKIGNTEDLTGSLNEGETVR